MGLNFAPLRPRSAQPVAAAAPQPEAVAPWATRVDALVQVYQRVQAGPMQGLPLLQPGLAVEAVGFQPGADDPHVAEGVLITPWFMSLLRLPLAWQDGATQVGRKQALAFGNEVFDFIAAHDPALGLHAACALFSPMGAFASQDQARDTAQAVLAQLRQPAAAGPATATAAQPPALSGDASARAPAPVPARRAFLLARRSQAAA